MNIQHIHIADIEVIRPSGVTELLCVSDTPMRPFPHTDPDRPNVTYRARIKDLPSWQSDIYADPARLAGSIGAGTLTLSSADGALSYLRGCRIGRVTIRRGREGLPWGEWTVMVVAQGEPVGWSLSDRDPTRVTIPLWDGRAVLDRDVQTITLAGTNTGATGLEGDSGMAGKVRPIALGDLSTAFLPAAWVNSSLRIAQLSEPGIGSLTGIYDRGGDTAITITGDYPGTLPATTLISTQAATDRTSGLVRLGGATGGDVQFGAIGVPAAGTTAPSIAAWLLARAGVAVTEIGTSVTALAATATAPCGLYLGDRTTYRPLIERLARSWGGWLVPDSLGVWQAGVLAEPGEPMITLTDNDVVRLEVDDPAGALPIESLSATWGEAVTTLTRDGLAGSARETPRESWLKEQTRTATATDSRVTGQRGSRTLSPIETALRTEAPAQALAARLLSVLGLRPDGEPRLPLRVAIEATDARLSVPLGASVRLIYAPDGIDRTMLLMGYQLWSPAPHLMWLRVFG